MRKDINKYNFFLKNDKINFYSFLDVSPTPLSPYIVQITSNKVSMFIITQMFIKEKHKPIP